MPVEHLTLREYSMLVLTRAIHESVIVGDEQTPHRVLKVTFLAIAVNHVQLGLELDDNERKRGVASVNDGVSP